MKCPKYVEKKLSCIAARALELPTEAIVPPVPCSKPVLAPQEEVSGQTMISLSGLLPLNSSPTQTERKECAQAHTNSVECPLHWWQPGA